MPACLHARLWRWKIKSDTCQMISQLGVLSGKTGGLAQSEVRDSNIDLFIYSLFSHLTPCKQSQPIKASIEWGRNGFNRNIDISAAAFFLLNSVVLIRVSSLQTVTEQRG